MRVSVLEHREAQAHRIARVRASNTSRTADCARVQIYACVWHACARTVCYRREKHNKHINGRARPTGAGLRR